MSKMCDSDLSEDLSQMRRRDIPDGMISQVDPAVSPGMENHRQLAAVQDLAHPSIHFRTVTMCGAPFASGAAIVVPAVVYAPEGVVAQFPAFFA